MPTDDELKRLEDAAEELERGYDQLVELCERLMRHARGMGADARMVRLRARSLRADLTPTRPASATDIAATREDSRSGLTSAGGFRVPRVTPKP